MKFLLLIFLLIPTLSMANETIIACENGRLTVVKECHKEGESPSVQVCDYELYVNDMYVIEQIFMDVDVSNVSFKVTPMKGWGNFDSTFKTIGTESRNSYMKVTLAQNGYWEELNLKTYTHYIGGRPYFYADWTFHDCKSVNPY